MKVWKIIEINRTIVKLRTLLGDFDSPPDEIRRPKGMEKRTFRRRVQWLAKLEHQRAMIVAQGLAQYAKDKQK